MNRNLILLGLACPGIAAAAPKKTPAKDVQRPNVVVFLVDDYGWMDVECYGSRFYQTPNIDKLASEGMLFTDAYAACTVSSPTRAAMMTGMYPARLHLTNWIKGQEYPYAKNNIPDWTMQLATDVPTVAEELKAKGYDTWHIGKWHLLRSMSQTECLPEARGFDVNIGGGIWGSPGPVNEDCKGYFPPYNKHNLSTGPEGEYLTDRLTAEAIKLIEANDGKPFFLNLWHYAVHTPLMGKPELIAKYTDLVDKSYFQKNATYAAMIQSVDESLGNLVAALKKKGVYDNTVIFFTSDNGALANISPSFPLRKGKGSEYEGGVRVPLIISWPGKVKAGAKSSTPVITNDIPTTIMAAIGSPQAAKTDGISLLPLFSGKDAGKTRPIFWHYPHYHPGGAKTYSSVRAGEWVLIEQLEDNSLELYNLKDDIGQKNDLAATDPAKAKELYALLDNWRKEVDAQMPTPNPNYDAAKANKQAKYVEEQ